METEESVPSEQDVLSALDKMNIDLSRIRSMGSSEANGAIMCECANRVAVVLERRSHTGGEVDTGVLKVLLRIQSGQRQEQVPQLLEQKGRFRGLLGFFINLARKKINDQK